MSEKKMRKIESGVNFINWKTVAAENPNNEEKVVFEGFLLRVGVDKFGKPSYEGKKEDGSLIVINSCGALDSKMKEVREGDFIQIIHKGVHKLKTGKYAGKDSHSIDVLVAEE